MNASNSSVLSTSTAASEDAPVSRHSRTARLFTSGAVTVLAAATLLAGGVVTSTLAAPASAATMFRPGSATTGVPAIPLRLHVGDLTITRAGTVIDALDIRGFVVVRAANVVIKRTIVRGRPATGGRGMVTVAAGGSLTIQDSSIGPTTASPYLNGIVGSNLTVRRVEIARMVDSVRIQGDNVLVENSWFHANSHYLKDPTQGNTPSHDDGIQIEKGRNITIRGNLITDADNVGIMVGQNLGTVVNLKVQSNYLDGGGCTVNLSEKGRGPLVGTVLTNNRFGRNTKVANCPMISPTTTTAKTYASGNVYNDNNAYAPIRKG